MADVARKALTDLEERTGTAYDDLMHVNSGGSDYKETKRNFLKGDLYYAFDVTTPITTQLENLPNGTYIGSIDSYGHQAETGVPSNNSYYVYARKTGGSNMFISLVGVNQSGYEYYKIKSTQGWASDWTQIPTRSEVNTLKAKTTNNFWTVNASSSKALTIANGTTGIVFAVGTASNSIGMWALHSSSTGTISWTPMITAGSNITATVSGSTITFANARTSGSIWIHAYLGEGSISG